MCVLHRKGAGWTHPQLTSLQCFGSLAQPARAALSAPVWQPSMPSQPTLAWVTLLTWLTCMLRRCCRERERERRLEAKEAHGYKKSKLTRDRDRDISEKVALGMAKVGTKLGRASLWLRDGGLCLSGCWAVVGI